MRRSLRSSPRSRKILRNIRQDRRRKRITQASASQRCGRAADLQPRPDDGCNRAPVLLSSQCLPQLSYCRCTHMSLLLAKHLRPSVELQMRQMVCRSRCRSLVDQRRPTMSPASGLQLWTSGISLSLWRKCLLSCSKHLLLWSDALDVMQGTFCKAQPKQCKCTLL